MRSRFSEPDQLTKHFGQHASYIGLVVDRKVLAVSHRDVLGTEDPIAQGVESGEPGARIELGIHA